MNYRKISTIGQFSFLILLFISFIIGCTKCYSQPIWKMDLLPGYKATGVIQDYDNGYLVSGKASDDNNSKGVIIKTDINGNPRYSIYMKSDSGRSLNLGAIASVDENSFLTAGSIQTKTNRYVPFVTRFNACKKLEWCMQFDVADFKMQCVDIVKDSTGNFLCLFTPIMNTYYDTTLLFVSKISKQGELLWINQYFTDTLLIKFPVVNHIIPTRDGGFMLSGCKWYSPPGIYAHYFRPFWARFDSEGNAVWDTEFLPNVPSYIWNGGESGNGFEDSNGTVYCAGSGGYMHYDAGCFYKIPSSGTGAEWHLVSPQVYCFFDLSTTIIKTNQNELLISNAQTWSSSPYWIVLSKVDTTGKLIKRYENYQDLFTARDVIKTSDRKILYCGNRIKEDFNQHDLYTISIEKYDTALSGGIPDTNVYQYDTHCENTIGNDVITFPSACSTISIPEKKGARDYISLKIFPNPATDFTTIEVPEFSVYNITTGYGAQQQYRPLNGEVQLSIQNLSGQIVKTEEFDASERNHVINVNSLALGMYMLHLTQKGKFVAQGKVMVVR